MKKFMEMVFGLIAVSLLISFCFLSFQSPSIVSNNHLIMVGIGTLIAELSYIKSKK